jgi:type 1 glutamine amidotransferase
LNILLVSGGLIHPPFAGRLALERGLRSLPGCRVRRLASLEKLVDLELDEFQVLVLYYHHRVLSPAALSTFERYVRNGGGVLAVHSALASFKGSQVYFEILGGRFLRHGPVERMSLTPVPDPESPFTNLTTFTITDELYRHEYDPGNRVHFTVEVQGEREPQVWTRSYGRGRVCYFAPGHRAATLRNPQVQQVLQRGLTWLAESPGDLRKLTAKAQRHEGTRK